MNLLIKDTKSDVPSFVSLQSRPHEGTLKQFLSIHTIAILKDKANINLKEKSLKSKLYRGIELNFEHKEDKKHLKSKLIVIQLDQHVLEVRYIADTKNFKRLEKQVYAFVNSLKIFERNNVNPDIFEQGEFKSVDKDNNVIAGYITRNASTHTEYINDEGAYVKSLVNWVSKDELHLTFIEDNPKGVTPFKAGDILKVKILSTGEDWYDCIWEINGVRGYQKYIKVK